MVEPRTVLFGREGFVRMISLGTSDNDKHCGRETKKDTKFFHFKPVVRSGRHSCQCRQKHYNKEDAPFVEMQKAASYLPWDLDLLETT